MNSDPAASQTPSNHTRPQEGRLYFPRNSPALAWNTRIVSLHFPQERMTMMSIKRFLPLLALLALALSFTVGSPVTAHAATNTRATPALPLGTPPPKHIGQQAHEQSASASTGVTPADVYFCDIFDYSSQSGLTFKLQVFVVCQIASTIQISAWMQICGYWNYSLNQCVGGWTNTSTVSCNRSNVQGLKCPNPALPISVSSGETVRGAFSVTTYTPGYTPATGTYYGQVFHF